ncbi:MAG: O-acetyl-ADP-ribose deacetylase [Sedimentisphaerales bacterium]|nr:O-acetyl-ADP-ribose deacetylase [Sedimentisphaerales bacterium]
MDKRIVLAQGDITRQDTAAIVNAANSSLLGGGGVDGAIHAAGGPAILAECKQIVARQGRCPVGGAVLTTGGNLKARYVIHTVGPVWRGGRHNEDKLLADAYTNCLALALEHHIRSIAFPSISTGAYRFPIERAAPLALSTVAAFLAERDQLDQVRFVLFGERDFSIYRAAYERLTQEPS